MTLIPKTQKIQKVLVHFFRINPSFLLGEALIELTLSFVESSLTEASSAAEASTQLPNSKDLGSSLGEFVQNVTTSFNISSNFTLAAAQSAGKHYMFQTLPSSCWVSILQAS